MIEQLSKRATLCLNSGLVSVMPRLTEYKILKGSLPSKFSLNLAIVHTSKARKSQWALNCQLILAKNHSYSGFLSLVMLKNQLIVSMVLKATFSKGFPVVLKPFWTPLSLKARDTHSCEVLSRSSISCLPRQLIHVLKWQLSTVIPAFLRTILLQVFLFFKMRPYGDKILDEIMIIIIITIINLWKLGHLCFPEIIPLSATKVNKNKQTTKTTPKTL